MAERRSMSNALSPEKVAFLRGEPEEERPSAPERSASQRSTVEKVQRPLRPRRARARHCHRPT